MEINSFKHVVNNIYDAQKNIFERKSCLVNSVNENKFFNFAVSCRHNFTVKLLGCF